MKKLIVRFFQTDNWGSGHAFLDEAGNVLGIVHENDAKWRHEYFDHILSSLGVEVEKGPVIDSDDEFESLTK